MPIKIQKLLFLLFLSFLFSNCKSVETYNRELAQPISVAKLHDDIDYTQRKLNQLYPNLHGYISKEKLDYKFDSIRKVVNQPMTSKDFYFVISPVIASVRQGHMNMTPVLPRMAKKEEKRLKKLGDGPMSQFLYEWENGKMFIIQNKSKNKFVKLGSEVISVKGIDPQAIYGKYKNGITSDGFNKTYIRKSFSKRYVYYMTNEIGINDSLIFVLKYKDSVFNHVISRENLKKKQEDLKSKKVKNDSIKVAKAKPIDKKKLKEEKKFNQVYGFNKLLNEYAKSLKFFKSDSTTAILRIKNFTDGNHKKAYQSLFDSIKKRNIKHLIIDIRDNPGGKVADAVNLYSHLTNKEFTILQPALVTSKTSLFKLGLFRNIPKIAYPFAGVFYPFYMGFSYLRTTKNSDGNYQYKLVGSREKTNAENYFDGKIYVLINGGSFSASCILSSSLKANPNVTFVGEETGGAFNGTVAGLMPIVDLPNSKIPLRLGLMDIKTINQTNVVGRGVFPDIEIPLTVDDKINNRDPQLDWILQDIIKKIN